MRTSKHPLSACVCGCLRMSADVWASLGRCLRMSANQAKVLGNDLPLCLRVSATKENGCFACGHMSADVCGRRNNFYFWQMSAALETKTTPKQGVRPWDFDFCAFLCRGANIATFPDGEIHSKMEMPTGPQTNPACIKTDAHRTNAFATWRSRWSLAFALTIQHHHEEKKAASSPDYITQKKHPNLQKKKPPKVKKTMQIT